MIAIKLLVRPRWIEGESWPGFLLRLANANGLPGIFPLANRLETSLSSLLVEQPRTILARLGYTADDIPRVRYSAEWMQPSRAGQKGDRRSEGLLIRGRRRETAVCPHCLAGEEIPHIRAIWERPLELGCRVHGTQLLKACQACGKYLSVARGKLVECACGQSLLQQEVARIDPGWTALLRPFDLKRDEPHTQTFRPTSPREIAAASAIERIALYERQLAPDKRKRRLGAKLKLADALQALPWFTDWPASFKDRYRCALEVGRTDGDMRRTSYIQAKTLCAPMFPTLHKAVRQVAYKLRYGPRTDLQLDVHDYLGSAQQSIGSAVKLLGLTRPQVEWMAKQGVLPGAKQAARGVTNIPTESVLDLMAEFTETEKWKSAADRRGCRHLAMKQLLRIGLIDAIPLGDYGDSRVFPRAWDDFADFLLSQARPVPSHVVGLFALEAVIAKSQYPEPDPFRTARIVEAVGNGNLPVYSRKRRPSRVSELFVKPSELKMVARRNA